MALRIIAPKPVTFAGLNGTCHDARAAVFRWPFSGPLRPDASNITCGAPTTRWPSAIARPLDRWQESKAVKKQIVVKYMVLSSLLIIIDRKTQHTLFGHNMKWHIAQLHNACGSNISMPRCGTSAPLSHNPHLVATTHQGPESHCVCLDTNWGQTFAPRTPCFFLHHDFTNSSNAENKYWWYKPR